MPTRATAGAAPPVTPQEAPTWFQPYGSDNDAVIRELLRRIADMEARLKAANIP